MNGKLTSTSLSQARVIADKNARVDLENFVDSLSQVLKSEYLEAEHCWMFFISEKINVPLDSTLGIKWAYVVSKKGTFSMVQDFSDDQKKLQTYLQTISNHFQKHGE